MDRKKLGRTLIILGVMTWPIGLTLKIKPIPNILFFHLILIIPGVYLQGSKLLKKISNR